MTIFDQLKRDEGIRNFPYLDTVGKVTIGVGRNLTDVGVSDAIIEAMLQEDVAHITTQLNSRLPYFQALDAVRQGVLVNMGFNLGFNRLEAFHDMLTAVAKGDWDTAAVEMLDSTWAKQVGGRAMRLAMQMRSGTWV